MVVAVFAESVASAYELLGKGRELADALGVPLVALSLGKALHDGKEFVARGADEVLEVQADALGGFDAGAYTAAAAAALDGRDPKVILIASTKLGRALAPSLGARFRCGAATDVSVIELDGGMLTVQRPSLGGNCLSVLRFTRTPQICTVPSGVFAAKPPDPGRVGKVTRLTPAIPAGRVKVLEVATAGGGGGRLEDAKMIVCIGRGVKKKEDLRLIEDLCASLGADIGCTRPISADLHWMDDSKWIGLSGHKVRPKLYIAIGISGQVQHVAGMRDAAMVISINKDREAPMVQNSDLYVVGDLYTVIPALIDGIRKTKGG